MTKKLSPAAQLMRQYLDEQKQFRVVSTTGSRVVILFAGIKEEFWFRHEQEPYRTPNNIPLDSHDEQVLFELARRARSASIAGYKPSTSNKTRLKVAPKPVINRRKSRSQTDIERARGSFLYQVCSAWVAGDKTFQLTHVTGQECLMYFNEVEHRLAWNKCRGRLWCDTKYWNGPEWFAFIRVFGDQMVAAAIAGFQSTNPPKKQKRFNPLPRNDPRQGRLL